MKKRIIAAALGIMMTVSLAGCSGKLSNEYVTINQYKGLEVEQVELAEVTDADIEDTINSYLGATPVQIDITDRAAQMGDIVNIDYVGSVDGVEFSGGSTQGMGTDLELGSNAYIGANGDCQGFEEQVVGHNIGENFDITVKFPADYGNEELNDKVAVFNITLNRIYQEEDAELTDEWVQSNSYESETVEEYREEIRKTLEESNQSEYDNTLQSEVFDAFLEQVEVKKLPQEKVDQQYEYVIEQYTKLAQAYGMEVSDIIESSGMTQEEFEAKVTEIAEDSVKRSVACELLAKKLKLEPSDEEYEQRVAEYAESYGYEDVDAFREAFSEDIIRNAVIEENVVKYLAENCVQVEKQDDADAGSEE